MLIFVLMGCNPMTGLQTLPALPLELGYERNYAPAYAGCTWTRSRVDGDLEEIHAEYDAFGRLLSSRVEDVNGVREVTNTWEESCLTLHQVRYSDDAWDEDRSHVCDEHGHVTSRTSLYFYEGEDGERVETFGEDTFDYDLTHDGDDWTGWASPADGWAYTFRFDGTRLLDSTWENFVVQIVSRSVYGWDDDLLASIANDQEDLEYGFEWEYRTVWTRDDLGRVVERDEDGQTTTYAYIVDAMWPEAAEGSIGQLYEYTWDCD